MITQLPIGTWVAYRYKNNTEYARIVDLDGQLGIETGPMPPTGATIHHGIWKKDEFHVRKIRTLK